MRSTRVQTDSAIKKEVPQFLHRREGSTLFVILILAAVSVVSLGLGLALNHLLISNYQTLMNEQRSWGERIQHFSGLSSSTLQISLPELHLSNPEDIPEAAARTRSTAAAFEETLQQLREEIDLGVPNKAHAELLQSSLDLIANQISGIREETLEAIKNFKQQDTAALRLNHTSLLRRRTQMDQEISKLTRMALAMQEKFSESFRQKAGHWNRLQSLASLLMLAAVLTLAVYGIKFRFEALKQAKREFTNLEKLEASETRFRTLTSYAPVGIYLTDENGQCLYVNERWQRLSGISFEKSLGDGWQASIHPRDLSEVLRRWNACLAAHLEFQQEFRFLGPEDRTVWVASHAVPLRQEKGKVKGYLGTVTDITARRHAEENLRASEERFKSLVTHVPGIIYRCAFDPQWTVYFISDQVETLTGYSPGDFIHNAVRSYASIIHLEDTEPVEKAVEEAVREKRAYTLHYRIITRDKRVRWVYERGQGAYDADGNVLWLDGAILDVTEQRQSQADLQRSLKLLQTLQHIQSAFIEDRDDRSLFPAILTGLMELTGSTAGFIAEMPSGENSKPCLTSFRVSPTASARSGQELQNSPLLVKRLCETASVEHPLIDPMPSREIDSDGHPLMQNFLGIPLRVEGRLVGVLGAANRPEDYDPSLMEYLKPFFSAAAAIMDAYRSYVEKKKAEASLHERESRISAIVTRAADGILTLNDSGTLLSFNPAAEKLFGCTASEVLGQNIDILMPGPFGDRASGSLMEWLHQGIHGQGSGTLETMARQKDGSLTPVELSISEWSLNGPNLYAAILRDIRERKLAEAKVLEAAEVKTEFAAMVSHELRTPLTAILEGVNLVHDGTFGKINQDQKEVLNIAKRNVERLSRLINDVLDFQKLETGHMQLDLQKIELNPLCCETLESFKIQAVSKGLQLNLDLNPELAPVLADRDRILQVLSNLVNNAIKFTDHGTITLRTASAGKWVLLTVQDEGRGIPKEDIPRLFQPFSQALSRGDRPAGTGLGLMICRQIVEKHNGILRVKSDPGAGSSFQITLPIYTGIISS